MSDYIAILLLGHFITMVILGIGISDLLKEILSKIDRKWINIEL